MNSKFCSGLLWLRIWTTSLWALCTALLLLPKPWILFWNRNIVKEVGFGEGIEHLYLFASLGFFVELSRRKWSSFTWLHILAAYGWLTEVLQHFIPLRSCHVLDWVQDCSGAYLGIVLGLLAKSICDFIFVERNDPKNFNVR